MKRLILAASAIILLAAGCGSSQPVVQQPVQTNTQSSQPAQTTTTGTKLSDEPYAKFAYEIDPNNLSAEAKQAATGFNISSQTLTNGDTQITLKATETSYHDQTYELKPGQKLYFIEKSMGDDTNGKEKFLGDDTAVIVDQNGYVVQ